jgi:hypothetical protein
MRNAWTKVFFGHINILERSSGYENGEMVLGVLLLSVA